MASGSSVSVQKLKDNIRWVPMRYFYEFWEDMTNEQRMGYYSMFLCDLDRLIPHSEARVKLAERLSEKYCRGGKCPFDYPCCRQCIMDGSRCNRWSRPLACCIWFCDYVLDKLNKRQVELMMYRRITKNDKIKSEQEPFFFKFRKNQKYIWKVLEILNMKLPPPPDADPKIWLIQLPTREWVKKYYESKGVHLRNKWRRL